jgi:hypothetical protein
LKDFGANIIINSLKTCKQFKKVTSFYAILIKNGSFRGLNYLFDVLSNASSVYSAVKRDVFSEGEGT